MEPLQEPQPTSIKENRIRNITTLYYSKPEVQNAIFEFSTNREISPRYFERFGKRPDTFQYQNDVFSLVKKGATSFHCSEEIWENPLELSTDLTEEESNKLRIGWDLLLDIDSKYIDYSKVSAQIIIDLLKFHGIKNFSIKFSGSKGFHIIIPWQAFPKEIFSQETSNLFPEYPRIITQYIMEKTKPQLIKKITELTVQSKYVRDHQAPKEVMPDLILVSPRHLFRMPYSLHEKTALASIVLDPDQIENFQLKDADPMKVNEKNIKTFYPEPEENEAAELLMQAMDWHKTHNLGKDDDNEKTSGKFANFKPLELKNLTDQQLPPCIKNILQGIGDGRKRALFALINLFRSAGIEKTLMETKIADWNKKNKVPLKDGYIKSQLQWSYRKKPIMPPNCKEFYQGIAVCTPEHLCSKTKNPLNYLVKKNFIENNKKPKKIEIKKEKIVKK